MNLNDDWQRAQTALAAPLFDAIRSSLVSLGDKNWPCIDQLNALADANNTRNPGGQHLRFILRDESAQSARQYETQIATTGEIPTRNNWHDLLNALQWLAFPNMKSTISSMHASLLDRGGDAEAKSRSIARDVLTMFDESGIIVASEDVALLQLIRDFQWQTLFVEQRKEVEASVRFILVGHGLMEKSLVPFIGMTAKAMLLNVGIDDNLDEHAANWLRNEANLQTARNLAPLPLLGIPGWDQRNTNHSFYANTNYFRTGYSRDLPQVA